MNNLLRDQAETISDLLVRVMRRLSATDEPSSMELPVAQVRVCSILLDGARTMSCLSKELGISLSAVTQIADRLEKSGLVERVAETDDRRVKSLQLTGRGVEAMRSRKDRRVERIVEALKRLSPETREQVTVNLQELFEAAAADEPVPPDLAHAAR